MSLTKIGSIGINTGIQFAGVTTVSTLHVGSGVTLSSDGDIFATGVSTFSGNLKVGSGVTISPDGDGFYTGVVTATTFSGALAASNLTGALPAISGANLTNLDASDLASGTVPTARLGSGTASSSTFLRGDSTFAEVTSTTINSNADNRIITGSGTANTLNGESTLTYDGDTLLSTNTNFVIKSIDTNASNSENFIQFNAGYITYDSDASNATGYSGHYFQADGAEKLRINASGQLIFDADTNTHIARPAADTLAFTTGGSERLRIASGGQVLIGTDTVSGYTNRIFTVAAADNDASIEIRTATDHAGQLSFSDGSAGDATNYRGYIQYNHDGDYMRFGTSSTEYVRIASNGKVGINMTNPDDTLDVNGTFQVSSNSYMSNLYMSGSLFIGGTGSANELDDYEEGTFNPTFVTSSGSISMNTSYDTLAYTKIGRMVHVMGQVVLSVSSPGGNLDMASLPFAFAQLTETSERGWTVNIGYFNGSGTPAGSNHFPFQARLGEGAGTSGVRLQGIAPNDDGSIADWCGNGTDLWFNFWYITT